MKLNIGNQKALWFLFFPPCVQALCNVFPRAADWHARSLVARQLTGALQLYNHWHKTLYSPFQQAHTVSHAGLVSQAAATCYNIWDHPKPVRLKTLEFTGAETDESIWKTAVSFSFFRYLFGNFKELRQRGKTAASNRHNVEMMSCRSQLSP